MVVVCVGCVGDDDEEDDGDAGDNSDDNNMLMVAMFSPLARSFLRFLGLVLRSAHTHTQSHHILAQKNELAHTHTHTI
jgi:hypothetical protein